jgi:death-on-curing protein
MQPLFLSLEKVIRLHQRLIDRYGGTEGVRDVGLLHSAVMMPQASYGGRYLHADIFEMAAAYLYHIVQNHPFVDGNKRAGAAAALVFLAMNDITIDNDEHGLVDVTLAVAAGRAGKHETADFFRKRAT